MKDCVNICLCHDVCIKNIQLQFLVKCTCMGSARWGESQAKSLLACIFCIVFSTSRFELVKFLYFLSVLGKVPFFPPWLKFFLNSFFVFSIPFVFQPFS